MEVQSVAQDEEGAKKCQVEEAKLIYLVGFCRLMWGELRMPATWKKSVAHLHIQTT